MTIVMPRFSLYRRANGIDYFNRLINDLSLNNNNVLPLFLLRAQLIEFSLKYLLKNYPFQPEAGFSKPISRMDMGNLIETLESLEDNHLDDIILEADNFRNIRNDLTHNILTGEVEVDDINRLAKEKLKDAYKIEKSILFFLTYLRETLME